MKTAKTKKVKKFDVKKSANSVALLKTLAHPLRYAIISTLIDEGEKEAGEIADMARGMHLPSQVSQYLTLMKTEGYISKRVDGRLIYYKVSDAGVKSVVALLRKLNGN